MKHRTKQFELLVRVAQPVTIEQLTTDDGNFYAVPFRSDFWVLYYNKDLFDAAGVEYPSNDLTMEDYDALARKMTSGSGDTKVYGCHYHTWRSAASLFSILDGKNTIIDGTYDFMKRRQACWRACRPTLLWCCGTSSR